MDRGRRLIRHWHRARDSLHATNLAFAAAVGRGVPLAEQLALAHEVARLQDEERRLATAARSFRLSPAFWITTIPNTLPGALG